MSICTESSRDAQDRRLRTKHQDQLLTQCVVEGTNLSSWEAKVLVDQVQHVYFSETTDRPLREGEMRYTCAATEAACGKPLTECPMVTVVLTIHDRKADQEILVRRPDGGAIALRRQRVVRLTEEAREQGGF